MPVSFQHHSFDLSCEKLYEFPFFVPSLPPTGVFWFVGISFICSRFYFIATRYGWQEGGVLFEIRWKARRGNVILTYCCNFGEGMGKSVRKSTESGKKWKVNLKKFCVLFSFFFYFLRFIVSFDSIALFLPSG